MSGFCNFLDLDSCRGVDLLLVGGVCLGAGFVFQALLVWGGAVRLFSGGKLCFVFLRCFSVFDFGVGGFWRWGGWDFNSSGVLLCPFLELHDYVVSVIANGS